MDSTVIASLVLAVAGIVCSGIFSYFFGYEPAKRKAEVERLRTKVSILNKDVRSLVMIEESLLEGLSKETGINAKTLKINVRKQVSDKTGYPLSENVMPSVHNKNL